MDDAVTDEARWDERYRSASRIWSGEPNPQLVAEAADLPAGTALDAGTGEGADAVWLAERGWTVTAVDVSSVALDRGRDAAGRDPATAGRITWIHADLTEWTPPVGAFDLVSVQFLQMPSTGRVPLQRRLAEAVAPGGLLLVVGHHPTDLDTTARRPGDPDLLFTAEDVADLLDDRWTVLVAEARPRPAADPDGAPITVHDSVLLARREPAT